jgi:hypothetical protein
MLHKILTIPRHAVAAVTARLKIMARCDTSERRKPQDGRIYLAIRDALFDIRFSAVPTIHGEKIVMRLLNKSSANLKLVDLGFDEEEMSTFNDLIRKPTAHPDHRPTRFRKIHDADRRTVQDRHGERERDDDRGPRGIPARPHQPGTRQRQGRPDLCHRAAQLHASGPGHHHGRRDPRL